jgi:hypothetical protein
MSLDFQFLIIYGQLVSPSQIMNGMELYMQFRMFCTNKMHIYLNPIDNWDKVKKHYIKIFFFLM